VRDAQLRLAPAPPGRDRCQAARRGRGLTVRLPLPGAVAEAILAHARAEAPNEACGFVIGSDVVAAAGEARRYVPCRNELASPTRYRVHAADLLRVVTDTERTGEEVWAIVHSHVRSAAVPSPTDIAEAAWPDALLIVVSLAGEPSLRAWRVEGGAAVEAALEVIG
jgi:[CysO sulfur-carrier protein]-S-L-cysteine hydrolase